MTAPDDAAEAFEDARELRLAALGARDPRCTVPGCAEGDPFALTGAAPDILCREHRAERTGRSRGEAHHPAGRANNSATVGILANDHALLSAYQALWPAGVLRNPAPSPLLRAAASLRGWLDVLRVVIERTVGWVPPFLEWLDSALVGAMGPRWWEGLGWMD